jgi:hypothetical protein
MGRFLAAGKSSLSSTESRNTPIPSISTSHTSPCFIAAKLDEIMQIPRIPFCHALMPANFSIRTHKRQALLIPVSECGKSHPRHPFWFVMFVEKVGTQTPDPDSLQHRLEMRVCQTNNLSLMPGMTARTSKPH